MPNFDDPVLVSVLQAACDATGAAKALLLESNDVELTVVAAWGDGSSQAKGVGVPLGVGVAGFVAASGQPVALAPHSADARIAEDVTAQLGWQPKAILTVPCAGNDTIAGVLELVDPVGGQGFNFDDVEITTLLAGVAGVALENRVAANEIASPEALSRDIVNLSQLNPSRYSQLAPMIETLLNSV